MGHLKSNYIMMARNQYFFGCPLKYFFHKFLAMNFILSTFIGSIIAVTLLMAQTPTSVGNKAPKSHEPVIIVGAGLAGNQFVLSYLHDCSLSPQGHAQEKEILGRGYEKTIAVGGYNFYRILRGER